MHWLTRSLLSAAALSALAVPAHAALTATGLSCNNGGVMTTGFEPDALACSGAWAGNDVQQRDDFLNPADPDEAESFAHHISQLLRHPDQAKRLSDAAYDDAMARFGVERHSRSITEIYRQLATG